MKFKNYTIGFLILLLFYIVFQGCSFAHRALDIKDKGRYKIIGDNKMESCKGYDILDTRTGKCKRVYV